jgi:hypothetical protein
MAKKRLILTRRRKTEVIDEDVATSENPQVESDDISDNKENDIPIENTLNPSEIKVVNPQEILPVLEIKVVNPQEILPVLEIKVVKPQEILPVLEIKVVKPPEILPVLEIKDIVNIPNSILNSADEPHTDQVSTLCKFNKVAEPLDISLNSVEILPDPVSDFNDSIRKLMLDRNDVYKPYVEETVPETTQDETGILPNQKIQDRNDKVKNSSRTMVPTSRRTNPVSNNRTL